MTLNYVFSLTGTDLASSQVVSWMFRSFEKSCPLREVRPLDWNLSLVLQCLSWPPFELLKLASDKHLTWKMSFLLAFASAKRDIELYGLSFRVRHSLGWRSCTFSFLPDYVAKTQNPSVPDHRFGEFMVPSLWIVTGLNSCSFPSELFRSTFPERSSIILRLMVSSYPLIWGRRGCLATPFLSGCGLSSPLLIPRSPRRIVVLYKLRRMRARRSLLSCYLRGTVQSIKF